MKVLGLLEALVRQGLKGAWPAAKELFSRLGRDAPAPARLAAIRASWAATRCAAAAEFAHVQGGATTPPPLRRGADPSPPYPRMFVPLAGSELTLGTGTTTAPSPPTPSDDQFLSPAFVQRLAADLTTDTLFGGPFSAARRRR